MRVSLERAQQLALDSLRALGYSGQDCRTIASHLMDCELRGLEYAGLARILSIAERLSVNPSSDTPMRVTRESAVSAQLDGGDRLGYLVAGEATRIAVEKARGSGIGAVGANNTWYTGMLSYYAEMVVAEGMVALMASNSTAWVAPFGGSEARFGTNPICAGFPGEAVPLIWDIGISEIIHAQAVIAGRRIARIHHLSQVNHGMARHGEGDLGLFEAQAVHAGDDQRGGVQNRDQSPQPGLIVVLRAEKTQHGIRQMALQDFGGPAFPVLEYLVEHRLLRTVTEP